MSFDQLSAQLREVSDSLNPEEIKAEVVMDKVAEFQLLGEALEIKQHPIIQKLNSEEFATKLAHRTEELGVKLAENPVTKARRAAEKARGFDSFVADRFLRRGGKVGKTLEKVRSGLVRADEAVGGAVVKTLRKVPKVGGGLSAPFVEQVDVNLPGKAKKYHGAKVRRVATQEVKSITAPFRKIQKPATGVLAVLGAMSIYSMLQRRKDMVKNQKDVMNKAASAIDHLVSENQGLQQENEGLREKLATYQRKEHAYEIASELVDKGHVADEDLLKTAQELIDSDKDLVLVKEGIATVQSLFDLGTLRGDPNSNIKVEGELDPLTDFLLNG